MSVGNQESQTVDVRAVAHAVFEQAGVGMAYATRAGQLLLVNHRACEILGQPEKDLLGLSLRSIVHPQDASALSEALDKLRAPTCDAPMEMRLLRPTGEVIWVRATVSEVSENLIVILQDITPRKRAERAHLQSEDKLRQLYELSEAVTRAQDLTRIYDLALRALRQTLGADRAALLLYDRGGVMRFRAWDGLTDAYRALAEGHSPWKRDDVDPQPVLTPDISQDESLGDLREKIQSHGIRALGFIPLVAEGSLLGKLMIYYDEVHRFEPDEVQLAQTIANHVAFAISRKLAEDRLRLYQQIVRRSVDAIAIIDPDGKYLEQNDAHAELLGYSNEALHGKTPAIHMGEAKFREIASALTTAGIYRGEGKSVTRDGRQLDIDLAAFTVYDSEGHPECFVGIKRDITDRKQTEMQLRESEARFRMMADCAPVMLWLCNPAGGFTWFNKPWLEFTGRALDEELGDSEMSIIHPSDRERMKAVYLRALENRQPFETEFRMRRADGEYRWVLNHGVPRLNLDGGFVGLIGSCKDITDRKRAVEAIENANQELEHRVEERTAELLMANQELEGFTYSVSHDLRAPLRAIMATSKILLEECEALLSQDHVHLLRRQADNARKLGALIDDLLKLSRLARQEIVREEIDLTAMWRELVEEFQTREEFSRVRFEAENGLQGKGDQKLIRFVLLNLMENAAKFSPDGGTVRLSCDDHAFCVSDEGIGFEMEYASKLFLPFERLVREDQFPGTGIGLANVKRIIDRHHGRVWAESEPGKGSRFYFTLPS